MKESFTSVHVNYWTQVSRYRIMRILYCNNWQVNNGRRLSENEGKILL